MKKTIKKSYLFIAMLTVMIVLLSSVVASIFISPNKAFALSNPSSAVQVANGTDLYDKNTQSFNGVAVADMLAKLFKGTAPIDYVKNHPFNPNPDINATTYMVDAPTINGQVGTNHGLVVTLGGLKWMAVSMTVTDSVTFGGKEDVVLTLYLADAFKNSQFESSIANGTKGCNMYSSSDLRQSLLTDDGMSMFVSGSFATKYLVQPKDIEYQQIESARVNPVCSYDYPNDSLLLHHGTDEWSPNWRTGKYSYSDSYKGISYTAWGNDYIWIPSIIEAGGKFSGADGVEMYQYWNLSNEQRENIGAYPTSWLRSGPNGSYNGVFCYTGIDSTDPTPHKFINTNVTNQRGVRPAIHLNLTEILENSNFFIKDVNDLTSVFNEKEQTVKSIATETKADWYNKDIYEHADNYINVTYSNGATGVKEADEYWAKLEITQNYTNALKTQVDDEGIKNDWSSAYTEIVKKLYAPCFRGTPNTSDPNHLESDTVRWIKITINKAEIDFSKVTWSQSEFEYNGQIQSVKITSGLPSFLTAEYDHNAKSAVGEYTASVINFTGGDPNYKTYTRTELANIPQLKHNWEITKKKVAVSWTKKNVTIGDITLPIPRLQVAENLANAIEYKYFRNNNLTDEVSLEQIFAENDISEIKSYYIQAIFTTNPMGFNNTNCIFVVDGNEENSVSEVFQTGSVINKVEVSLKNNKFTYNGTTQQAEFNVAGGGLTASNLVISYTTADGTPLSGAPTNVGRYKVLVGLQSGLDDFMIVGDDTFDFEIESLKIRKPKADQVNIFDAEGFGLSAVANMPTNWKSYFEITVDGNVVDENYKFAKAGKYSIQISFKNGVNTANGGEVDNVVWDDRDNTTFTISLDIQTLELEISGWQNGTGNKRPTLLSDDRLEIEKYFDYEIYQVKDGQIIGNVILPTATLKYDTNYQISLKVKNEYKGSVFVKYNGQLVDETETYSFKTEVNPNPSGGDGEDDNNNGTDGKPNGGSNGNTDSGMNSVIETLKNMPPYMWWILIAVFIFMIIFILLLIIILIVVKRNKNTPQQAIPYAQYAANNQQAVNENNSAANTNEDNKPKEVVNVRGTIVNNYKVGYKDWTFVLKETDVLNLDMLESPQDELMFYAFKKNDLRKVKKLQNQIDQADGNVNTDSQNETQSNTKKQKGKKRN